MHGKMPDPSPPGADPGDSATSASDALSHAGSPAARAASPGAAAGRRGAGRRPGPCSNGDSVRGRGGPVRRDREAAKPAQAACSAQEPRASPPASPRRSGGARWRGPRSRGPGTFRSRRSAASPPASPRKTAKVGSPARPDTTSGLMTLSTDVTRTSDQMIRKIAAHVRPWPKRDEDGRDPHERGAHQRHHRRERGQDAEHDRVVQPGRWRPRSPGARPAPAAVRSMPSTSARVTDER